MAKHIVVLGGGLAAVVAAHTALEAGARVTVCPGRAATLGEFHGRLDVFGPPALRRGPSLPTLTADAGAGVSGHTEPNVRMQDLLRLRPWHPYTRLDLGLDEIRRICAERLAAIDAPFDLGPAGIAPTDAGTAVVVDGLARSAWRVDRPRPLVWLGLSTADSYPALGSAQLFGHQIGLDARDLTAIDLPWPDAKRPINPAAPLGLLDAGPDSAAGRAFTEAVVAAVGSPPDQAVILLPPILGRSFEVAAAWCEHLTARLGHPVRERLPIEQPTMALRLLSWIGTSLEVTGITRLGGAVESAGWQGGERIASLEVRVGGELHALGPVDAVILATGRFLGGGLRTEPPLRERLFGAPVYLQGQVLDTADTAPTELLGLQVWDDHPVMTLGVGIDRQCHVLGGDGRPRLANLYAAGRLIGGTQPALDGTAAGVDLVTAATAARAATGADRNQRRSAP